jgi:starch-binding outer membrane protein, SusD/RagB family
MNRVNINAYRARIALYKGDFAKAIEYADYVINSNVKPLGTLANFQTTWTESNYPNIPESLFRLRAAGNSSNTATIWMTTGQTVYVTASDKLINSYGAGDLRKNAFTGFITAANKPYLKKMTGLRPGLPALIDLKAMRTAEMYLIRAEAYAKQTSPNLTLGAFNLNEVRKNRITGYTDVTFTSAADLLTAVLDERFKELCFEGHRLFDLKRNNLPVQRSGTDASPEWQTLPAGNFRFTFPIPQYEMLANPNATQNEGY